MSKRRTKRDKKSPKYTFLVSWDKSASNSRSKASVKSQLGENKNSEPEENEGQETPMFWPKSSNMAHSKKDIAKSLILASLILSLEIVLYLAWP